MDAGEVVALVESHDGSGLPFLIANHNLHSIFVFWTDEVFRSVYERASVVLIDGWPVLAWARWFARERKLSARHRIGSTDWVLQLLKDSVRPLKIVAVGGSPLSSAGAAEAMLERFPRHEWRAYDGFEFQCQTPSSYGCSTLHADLVRADVVLVGMGMPHQESWILENWSRLSGAVVANVGGCFDYFSGVQDLAPRWMGSVGLEWAFRLCRSPRRLAYRYLVEPFLLLALVGRRALRNGVRRFQS
ncbi:WecB/TagA/CpsF family glycosyltransferase [Gordonia amicalis]|uniref:WecB/TagA/CpsF family glycosyltransferase n=1 Tax=Gordonia amicalis TaxID=89053 RepID=UPI0009E059EE